MGWFSNLLARFRTKTVSSWQPPKPPPPEPQETPPAVAHVAPAPPEAVDVVAGAFIDRDDFMKAIARSSVATYLDGVLVHGGSLPGVKFYTQMDGRTITNVPAATLPSSPPPPPPPQAPSQPVRGNTPDPFRWPDVDENGLPKIYMLAPGQGADAGKTVVFNPASYSVVFDGQTMPPSEVATYRARLAAREVNLRNQNPTPFTGSINPATLTDANWCYLSSRPELWSRVSTIFSGTLPELNVAINNWYSNGNKNAKPEAGPLAGF